jgi:hypothetical protein
MEDAAMTSIISVDSRLAARLPPRAQLKLRRLVDRAQDLQSAFFAVIGRGERILEERGHVLADQRQAIEHARAVGGDPDEAAARFAPALRDLEGELSKLSVERARRDRVARDAAQLVARIGEFLARLPEGAELIDLTAPDGELRDDQNYATALNLVRAEILQLYRSIRVMLAAPLPASELKQKAKQFVAELKAAGTPELFVQDGKFEVRWPPGATATIGTLAPGPLCAAVWAYGTTDLLERLNQAIDKISGCGLPELERPLREASLRDEVARLEFEEENLIAAADEAGHDFARRPEASPWAVLGVAPAAPYAPNGNAATQAAVGNGHDLAPSL